MAKRINNKLIYFIFFIGSISHSYSQQAIHSGFNSTIKSNEYLHTLEQEKFFLHTNKTIYYPGEKIWYKAYVASDLYNNPYLKTSNLYINLYTPELAILSSDLLFVNKGKANGEISLPPDLPSGTYFLQLETEFSKNFNNKYIAMVEVINSNVPKPKNVSEKAKAKGPDLKIEFYPESGILLERADNNIVIKTTYKERPVIINGKLIDNKTGRKLHDISTDSLGLGVFELLYYPERTYNIQFEFLGKKQNYPLPVASKKGFAIEKKGINEEKISFKIKTNKATLEENTGKQFYGVLHRRGIPQQVFPFKLDPDFAYYGIDINKANTLAGINTFTLFNDRNEPISERLFYVDKGRISDLKIEDAKKINDTLHLAINSDKINSPANLSISVLPSRTKVYNNFHNILSSFLIEPYIPDSDSKFISFLNGKYSEKKFDNHLITLHDFDSFPDKELTKKEEHIFEQGLKITGRVYSKNKFLENGRVMLSSEENNLLLIKDIENRNHFVFDSLYLSHSSDFKLALIDKRGKIVPATFDVEESFSTYTPEENLNIVKTNPLEFGFESKGPASFYDPSTNQLDEVLLEGQTKKIDYSELISDPTILGGSWNEKAKIDKNLYSGDNTMLDVIKDLPGIDASLEGGKLKIRNNRGFKSMIERQDPGEGSSSFDMLVILNGNTVSEIGLLKEFRADDIKSVKVNSMGAGYGLQGMNGVILIETKTALSVNKNFKPEPIKNTFVSTTEFGFKKPSAAYEEPFLIFPNNLSREYFSTIYWMPNFDLLPANRNYIEFPLKDQNDILLVINGLSEEGQLIYQEIEVSLKKK